MTDSPGATTHTGHPLRADAVLQRRGAVRDGRAVGDSRLHGRARRAGDGSVTPGVAISLL